MKKAILMSLFIIIGSLVSKAQVIDTTITQWKSAKINNLLICEGFPVECDTATHLGVVNFTDDLKGKCVAYYVLFKGRNQKSLINRQYELKKDEYDNWDGSPEGLLFIIGLRIGITFKNN